MGTIPVDQVGPGRTLVQDVDSTLSEGRKNQLLLAALPGATAESYAGERVVCFEDQVILKKQITHLGKPWPGFKKRIQIPRSWLRVAKQAREDGLVPRFMGIYSYGTTTVFVDFEPTTYEQRKANNSAAHVATNDLFQALVLGTFSREDRNENTLTSVRADELARYLRGGAVTRNPHLEVFERFNEEFFATGRIEALDAVKEMHGVAWPDAFQGEWPGFYLEYRLHGHLRLQGAADLVVFQKEKRRGLFDYDLVFRNSGRVDFYGDLKASNIAKVESPGNDEEDIRRCVSEFGRFWYVIYEHETWHARHDDNRPTIAWNEWKDSVGYRARKEYDPLSYASRFKAAVHFRQMKVLEINAVNFDLVLGDFRQGVQQGGAERALKVMINKRNIDNFLVFSAAAPE